jgi:hypothetical protein
MTRRVYACIAPKNQRQSKNRPTRTGRGGGRENRKAGEIMDENEIMEKLDEKLANMRKGIVNDIMEKIKSIQANYSRHEFDKMAAIKDFIIERKIVTSSELYANFSFLGNSTNLRQKFYKIIEAEAYQMPLPKFIMLKHDTRTGVVIAYIGKPSLEGYAAQIFDEIANDQTVEPHIIQLRCPDLTKEDAIKVIEIQKKYFKNRIQPHPENPHLPIFRKKF